MRCCSVSVPCCTALPRYALRARARAVAVLSWALSCMQVVCGGVAANLVLRQQLRSLADELGTSFGCGCDCAAAAPRGASRFGYAVS